MWEEEQELTKEEKEISRLSLCYILYPYQSHKHGWNGRICSLAVEHYPCDWKKQIAYCLYRDFYKSHLDAEDIPLKDFIKKNSKEIERLLQNKLTFEKGIYDKNLTETQKEIIERINIIKKENKNEESE